MKLEENSKGYEDIIHLQRPISKTHFPMSIQNRAAQFSPFAALTGHKEAISETARLTNQRIELDESEKMLLDEVLQEVQQQIERRPTIEVTYFEQDQLKEGGAYVTTTGRVRRLDSYRRAIVFDTGRSIRVEDVIEMKIQEME